MFSILTITGSWVLASKDNEKQFPPRNYQFEYFGGHGYDPREEKMRATFLAKGPGLLIQYRKIMN